MNKLKMLKFALICGLLGTANVFAESIKTDETTLIKKVDGVTSNETMTLELTDEKNPVAELPVTGEEPVNETMTLELTDEKNPVAELPVTGEKPVNETMTLELTDEKNPVADIPVEQEITSKYKYVKNAGIFVYTDETKAKKIDKITKGTRIEVLETKEITEGEKKLKVNKIRYRQENKDKYGWVGQFEFADSMHEVVPASWTDVTFEDNVPSKTYTNNPRVEAKGIYVSIHTLWNSEKLEKLIQLAKDTEINAFVIDVKDDLGILTFDMDMTRFGMEKQKSYAIKDIKEFMKVMKENNIYTIARIVTFKDPAYAKVNPEKAIITKATGKPYSNKDGLIWVSAHDRNLWDYNLSVSEEAAKVGFNEIQFDYVRFPASAGGKLDSKLDYRNELNESKPGTIQKYLTYAKERLDKYEVYTSADVYGQVGTFKDDMGLGQHWESVSLVVDYICPMMYPSHYGVGSYGVKVPDADPYKIIYHSVKDSVNRNGNIDEPAMIRPWIQDFTARWVKGHIKYGEKEVRAQIKALNDMGVKEYILWSPSNNYNISKK